MVGVVLYTEVSFGAQVHMAPHNTQVHMAPHGTQVHMAPRFPRPRGCPRDFPRALLGALEKRHMTLLQ